MKRRFVAWMASTLVLVTAPAMAQVDWVDNFDSYGLGPLAAQSDWEEWTGSTDVDADVSNAVAFTAPHSLLLVGDPGGSTGNGDDIVYNFANLPGGQPGGSLPGFNGVYVMSIKSYVDSGQTGSGWFIMMNNYPNNLNWSIQVILDAAAGTVSDNSGSGGTDHGPLTVRYDEWVNIQVFIDLDRDRIDIFYGNQLLVEGGAWASGSGNPRLQIAALDLYAGEPGGGTTGMFYDNPTLRERAPAGPALALDFDRNPLFTGDAFNMTIQGPELTNEIVALFMWSIDQLPGFPPLMIFTLPLAGGSLTIPGVVPPLLAGLDFRFRVLTGAPGGGLSQSNEELVLFR